MHPDDSHPMLLVFLSLFYLLGSCVNDEDLFTVSVCHNIIGFSELLEVLLWIICICTHIISSLLLDSVYG